MVERNAEAPQEKQIDTKQFPYGIGRPVRVCRRCLSRPSRP